MAEPEASGAPAQNHRPPIIDAELAADAGWPPAPPVRLAEILAVIGLVIVADLTVYRGAGYSGIAALLAAMTLLLWVGKAGQSPNWRGAVVTTIMLWVLAARVVWCGTVLRAATGSVLVMGLAVALAGLVPYVAEILVFPPRMIFGGTRGIIDYARRGSQLRIAPVRIGWLSVLLPLVTVVLFSMLFVLANPDLLSEFGQWADRFLTGFRTWMIDHLPPATEIAFWALVAWLAIGMLRPFIPRPLFDEEASSTQTEALPPPSAWYAAARNTLVGVILLFAVYLVFEYKTLWFRVFPEGFYYSGYAHQGAAWLTVALALATIVLSLTFHGQMLRDPRIRTLRQMAWIWSLQNMLLAVAVYHRLFIYIGFNGWTPMRMVGLFGISAVVVGFLLVLWKIAHDRSFLWLVHRHAWTVAVAVYLFALTPIDAIVTQLNVRRILGGDPAPSVQISVHAIGSEGIALLEPLLKCRDPLIREGVRAMLAQRYLEMQQTVAAQRRAGWTAYQCADRWVLHRLEACRGRLTRYEDAARRAAALEAFHNYAYQWY